MKGNQKLNTKNVQNIASRQENLFVSLSLWPGTVKQVDIIINKKTLKLFGKTLKVKKFNEIHVPSSAISKKSSFLF